MNVDNCYVGSFYLSMTEQSTEGRASTNSKEFVVLGVVIITQTAMTLGITRKCTYSTRVLKLFVRKVQITSLSFAPSGVSNHKETYGNGLRDRFYTRTWRLFRNFK
jgi:hypothetical protein